MEWANVVAAVEDAEQHGTVGVSVIGPDGGRWAHNGDRKFRAASIVKIPLMIEVYRRVERGETALDSIHRLKAGEKAPGSGVMLHLHDGVELTINDLIYLTISISDNTATNLLIRLSGMGAVNATMRELKMTGSNLGREMKNRPAVEGEQENWSTADDYTNVLQAILDGKAASAASCEAMIEMLRKQQSRKRISRFLPEDESIVWGSKTGSIKSVTNDAGFIRTPRGTLIITVLCEGMGDQHRGEQVIGEISRAAMIDTGIVEPLPII
ncbi:MAG TPA: serine hydrolase [Thermomicrobiales bacterium]|nr:serine hydrolase [Thermomicrobiales bacterium]